MDETVPLWHTTDRPERRGAIAHRQCMNPDCLAEEGERHHPDCTPDPAGTTDVWQDRRDWA